MRPNLDLDSVLNYDPVAEAEAATGKGIDDPETGRTALRLVFMSSASQTAALLAADDTCLFNDYGNYRRIIMEEGFRQVLVVPFHSDEHHKDDRLELWWHDDGILLDLDTYSFTDGCQVNRASLYYNLLMPNTPDVLPSVSNGGFARIPGAQWTDDGSDLLLVDGHRVWVGNHDARVAFRHRLAQLRSVAKFLRPWAKRTFLWLTGYGETTQKDREARKQHVAARIAMLPADVQEALGPDNR